MKLIRIITPHYYPENTACSNRIEAMVRELSKYYSIDVFTLSEMGKPAKDYSEDGVNVYYKNHPFYDKNSFFKRFFYEAKYARSLFCSKKKYEVTIVTVPFLSLLLLSPLYLANKSKILDVRDLVWRYLPSVTFAQKCIKKLVTFSCNRALNTFDHITVTNDNEFSNIVSSGFNRGVSIIQNGISFEKFEALSSVKYCSTSQLSVLYIGNVGLAQNLDLFLQLSLSFPHVSFDIVGEGSDSERLKEEAQQLGCDNVTFHGKLDWQDLLDFYNKATVLYASLGLGYESAVPSKLYEYAATGKKILYIGEGVAGDVVSKFEYSIAVSPKVYINIEDCLCELLESRNVLSKNNRLLVESKFIREKSCMGLDNIVESISINNMDCYSKS